MTLKVTVKNFYIPMATVLAVNGSSNWIVDSEATSHMCSDEKQFTNLHKLEHPMKVTLCDGRKLSGIGRDLSKEFAK